jgi:hypothetical protein
VFTCVIGLIHVYWCTLGYELADLE